MFDESSHLHEKACTHSKQGSRRRTEHVKVGFSSHSSLIDPSHKDALELNNPKMSSSSTKKPSTTVELSVKCKDITNKDMMSKSDPICLVKQKTGVDKFEELGRTEQIKDCLSPEFMKKIVVPYNFEERQELRFELWDVDNIKKKVEDQKLLGYVDVSLGKIVNARGIEAKIEKGKGSMIIVAKEASLSSPPSVNFIFNLEPPSWRTRIPLSEWIKNDLNPTWKPFSMSLNDLCDGELNRLLKIDVFDYSSNGKHDFIGEFETSVSQMMNKRSFEVINPKKKEKKKYTNSGVLNIISFNNDSPPSFLDFIQGGMVMNFSVAIDFTASNGNIRSRLSLHHRNDEGENDYTVAIQTVGDIIEDYDTDKKFPAFGFGARLPPNGEISHDFFLNLKENNPFCEGVRGILDAYYSTVDAVELYGPTNFSPCINRIKAIAQSHQDGKQYYVLLILTDGAITDMAETKKTIVEASNLPMSIIIIGVGSADFSSMIELDSDDALLKDEDGNVAARDIVQFVEMAKYVKKAENGDIFWDRASLAYQVMVEIPKQVLEWTSKRGIKPLKA
ncbi:Copine-7,Copine-3,Copine-9,Copine-5,Copine-6,Copine-2,Copine-4,Copine-8,Copine-1 [Lepeophtheirus salmonis]|uniref:Copine-7,Copine-3,Copine-9,Copine-5,Copine-6,Copi ne-2,Copine-4,Copine-8,Copine-1 n=1 Tax=Lepeophtheirus salmonis TaxID=72036 RepID=A0A7R8H567_LEPSM|nr:Copine-7,Copine-3,Copine-9,Copine-5,Copine-6,Copine-2,Copine-4,Copine-8,Copine-1 [Lepeophtheirus salmonis]CAF2859054.1 Copine-7,Copine-3,Copine-9,Copine-5,Copine-6,Copine-2,Copine-4,Copine-8,Copine-1 [Lepeophtheirus salmonis]